MDDHADQNDGGGSALQYSTVGARQKYQRRPTLWRGTGQPQTGVRRAQCFGRFAREKPFSWTEEDLEKSEQEQSCRPVLPILYSSGERVGDRNNDRPAGGEFNCACIIQCNHSIQCASIWRCYKYCITVKDSPLTRPLLRFSGLFETRLQLFARECGFSHFRVLLCTSNGAHKYAPRLIQSSFRTAAKRIERTQIATRNE